MRTTATQYTDIAASYVAIKDADAADKFAIFPTFYSACGSVCGKSVLELGCGEGRAGRGLLEHGAAHIVGIDQDPAMLELARSRQVPHSEYRYGVVGSLGRIGQFDRVIGPWILHYSRTIEELVHMFCDVANNLKHDGVFVALNEDPDNPTGGTERIGYIVSADEEPLVSGGQVTVRIFGKGTSTAFKIHHWKMSDYKDAAHEAGLTLTTVPFVATAEGRCTMGNDWCDEFMANRTSCVFQAWHRGS